MTTKDKLIEKHKELVICYKNVAHGHLAYNSDIKRIESEITSLESELAKEQEPEVDINHPFFGNSGATVPMKKPEGVTAKDWYAKEINKEIQEFDAYDRHVCRIAESYAKSKQINLREELIAYDKWMLRMKWGSRNILSPEKAADEYLQSKEK